MHVVTRILCLAALAAGLAPAAPAALAAATGVFLLACCRIPTLLHEGRATLVRLRWLFISLLILYGWFSPGHAAWPAAGLFSPTWEGLRLGLLRCWMLWLMGVAARMLLQTTSRPELIAGLHWLLHPLAWLGLRPERFCLRLVMTLDYALELKPTVSFSQRGRPRGRLFDAAVKVVHDQVAAVEGRIARAPLEAYPLPHPGAPPWWQWLVPMAGAAVLWLLSGAGF